MNETRHTMTLVAGSDTVKENSAILSEVIGQQDVIKKLKFFVDSTSPTTPFPTMLFTGSQGLGKTYIAGKLAAALGRELVEVNCGTILTASDFVEKILFNRVAGNTPKTLLLDEAHKLPSEVTTILLTLLNPNRSNRNLLPYNNIMIDYDLSQVNVVLATTDAHKIFKPLLNRCVEVYFQIYQDNDELFKVLKLYIPGIRVTCSRTDIAQACRGRARDAFLLAQNIERYCIMRNTNTLNTAGWEELKSIFNIYPMGLRGHEISLLRVISASSPISCNNIAIRMGVQEENVESEIEIRPREIGFVESTSKGRQLTAEGCRYLRKLDKAEA